MDARQRELLFATLLASVFSVAAVGINLFGLGEQPIVSIAFLLVFAFTAYTLASKLEHQGMPIIFGIFVFAVAFLAAALKTGLGLYLIASVAFPALLVAALATLGPLRTMLFKKE